MKNILFSFVAFSSVLANVAIAHPGDAHVHLHQMAEVGIAVIAIAFLAWVATKLSVVVARFLNQNKLDEK